MAFAADPIAAGGIDGLGGIGGLPLGAGIGKSLNMDISGGAGLFGGGLGGLGGGWGGVPYVPVTPLGALAGFKGDLIVPIVIVGVAVFLLLLIVLAVKFALAFKIELLKSGKLRRDVGSEGPAVQGGPPQEDQLNNLAHLVITAIQSQSCAQNVVCELGIMARERQTVTSLLKVLETLVPSALQDSVKILRSSAEGSFKCEDKYPCATKSTTSAPGPAGHRNTTTTITTN